MSYDVVIVGGGPAGSLAAINLIGSGAKVLLVDRARFPRLKPCGGGIRCSAYERFGYIREVLGTVPTNFVTRVVMESPAGERVVTETGGPMYAMIRRIELDDALLSHAKAGGIEVREDVHIAKVKVEADGVRLTTTTGDEIMTAMVIGADGVNSTVALQTGVRGKWATAQLAMDGTEETPKTSLETDDETLYVYYGVGKRYGYGYVFPKATHVNFGLGYLVDDCRQSAKGASSYEKHLGFLEQMKQKGILRGSSVRENFHSYVLPIGGPAKRTAGERVLLAGDAGGYVNGFTGEGIYYAMVTGEHAGRTAAQAVKEKNFSTQSLARYQQAADEEVGDELRASVRVQRHLQENPGRVDSIIRMASRSEKLRRLVTECALGMISHEEMKKRAIREALPAYIGYKLDALRRKWFARS